MDHRNTEVERGVVHQISGREVVPAIDHDVVPGHDVEHVLGCQPFRMPDDLDIGVQVGDAPLRRIHLRAPDLRAIVDYLPLEIRRLHHIGVDDAEGPDTGRCQIQRCW